MTYPVVLSQGWSALADDIDAEVRSARRKFPSSTLLFEALVEEVGELARALLERDRLVDAGADAVIAADDRVHGEAVQVAALVVRLLTEGQAEHAFVPLPAHARDAV